MAFAWHYYWTYPIFPWAYLMSLIFLVLFLVSVFTLSRPLSTVAKIWYFFLSLILVLVLPTQGVMTRTNDTKDENRDRDKVSQFLAEVEIRCEDVDSLNYTVPVFLQTFPGYEGIDIPIRFSGHAQIECDEMIDELKSALQLMD
jgi:uncharacterized membrane protein